MFSPTEAEGTRKRHQVDSIVEGVGMNRMTANLEKGLKWIDDAVKVSDEEAIDMSRKLLENDGFFIGSSSSVNCVAAVKVAQLLGPVCFYSFSFTTTCILGTCHCDYAL